MGDAAPKSHLSQLSGHWQKQEINKTNWEERKGKCDWLRWGFRLSGCTQLITSSGSPNTFPFPPPHHYPPFIHLYGLLVLPFALTLSSLRPLLLLFYSRSPIIRPTSFFHFLFPSLSSYLQRPTQTIISPQYFIALWLCEPWSHIQHPVSLYKEEEWNVNQASYFGGFLHSLPENVDATFFPTQKYSLFRLWIFHLH